MQETKLSNKDDLNKKITKSKTDDERKPIDLSNVNLFDTACTGNGKEIKIDDCEKLAKNLETSSDIYTTITPNDKTQNFSYKTCAIEFLLLELSKDMYKIKISALSEPIKNLTKSCRNKDTNAFLGGSQAFDVDKSQYVGGSSQAAIIVSYNEE
ncbi:hypothetical protein BY996DRAFT_8311057 [Phakopsora pachyrhizi]|nr:hypothetical protein BY996DRAFT_8311057 [Phakopsora pachyrhizi]